MTSFPSPGLLRCGARSQRGSVRTYADTSEVTKKDAARKGRAPRASGDGAERHLEGVANFLVFRGTQNVSCAASSPQKQRHQEYLYTDEYPFQDLQSAGKAAGL